MLLCKEQLTLPTLSMIGGGQKNLYFNIIDHKTGAAVDVTGCTAKFSIINCSNKGGIPFVRNMTLAPEIGANVFLAVLESEDTAKLFGKYIYQIWIKGVDGIQEEPQQGELYIKRNIETNSTGVIGNGI